MLSVPVLTSLGRSLCRKLEKAETTTVFHARSWEKLHPPAEPPPPCRDVEPPSDTRVSLGPHSGAQVPGDLAANAFAVQCLKLLRRSLN